MRERAYFMHKKEVFGRSEGGDIVIDKRLYVQRGCHTGQGTDDNTQEYQEKAKFIMKNIL